MLIAITSACVIDYHAWRTSCIADHVSAHAQQRCVGIEDEGNHIKMSPPQTDIVTSDAGKDPACNLAAEDQESVGVGMF
eukprot:2460255-Amphidinium_carterae.1